MGLTINLLSSLFIIIFITSTAAQTQPFKCTGSVTTCNAIIDYVVPNTTTISAITRLFSVTNFPSYLGVNNLPLSTLPTSPVIAKRTVRIPIPCRCTNGTGKSNQVPVYTVVPEDGLYHIAAEVFSRLVLFPQIQEANNITDADEIKPGQKLWIPLPCSCDDVDGQKVVHYGYVVPGGDSVEGIALRYNTSEDVLLRLNNLTSPKDLQAGAVLDVPLKACTSAVSNNSLDYPLLVPNNTYVVTATDCVKCTCNAANNWILHCEPSHLNTSRTCPTLQCESSDLPYLGNTTTSGCNHTTCSYNGYTDNATILTSIIAESTCPVSSDNNTTVPTPAPAGNNASAVALLHGWRTFLLISFHSMILFSLFR